VLKPFSQIVRVPSTVGSLPYITSYYQSPSCKTLHTKFWPLVEQHTQFITLSAGNGGVAYEAASKGLKVAAYDRSVYTILSLDDVLNRDTLPQLSYDLPTNEWFERWCSPITPSTTNVAQEGVLVARHTTQLAPHLSLETAKYLDTLLICKNYWPLLMSSIGRTLLQLCSNRGVRWSNLMPDGRSTRELTPEEAFHSIARSTWRTKMFSDSLDHHLEHNLFQHSLFDDLLSDFRDSIYPNTLVHIDPVYPWETSLYERSHHYFCMSAIDSILVQSESASVRSPSYWPSTISTDLTLWLAWFGERLRRLKDRTEATIVVTFGYPTPTVLETARYLTSLLPTASWEQSIAGCMLVIH